MFMLPLKNLVRKGLRYTVNALTLYTSEKHYKPPYIPQYISLHDHLIRDI